jgi:hypothetical protein
MDDCHLVTSQKHNKMTLHGSCTKVLKHPLFHLLQSSIQLFKFANFTHIALWICVSMTKQTTNPKSNGVGLHGLIITYED